MKKSRAILVLFMTLLFTGACSAAEEVPPLVISQELAIPTEAPKESSVLAGTAAHRWTDVEGVIATTTQVPEPTSSPIPTPSPTESPEMVASVSDECLACHMDKDKLVETAAPEEKAPSESSGVG